MSLPSIAWTRRMDEILSRPGKPKKESFDYILTQIPSIIRLWMWKRRERAQGRDTIMDPFGTADTGPVMGAPLGGIGGGTITRGWRGGFVRWGLEAGRTRWQTVHANQFSVYARRPDGKPRTCVLHPDAPKSGAFSGWEWKLRPDQATYHALYPRAWTEYEEAVPGVRLTCRQITPIIPHNYKESSYPTGVFHWTVENTGNTEVEVGLMFTWANGIGSENDSAEGHYNQPFMLKDVTGVTLHHTHRQRRPLKAGQKLEEQEYFEDPLTFAIAAQGSDDVEVSYRTRWIISGSGMDLWGDFRDGGRLSNIEDQRPSSGRAGIGSAVCATVTVPAGDSREVVFSLAWDMPLARFGDGRAWYRRYTKFYGTKGDAAPQIAADALKNYPKWEKDIEKWQKPILNDRGLPDWYKATLFNETYFIADGGSVWTAGRPADDDGPDREELLPEDPEIGHFAYLEGHEYRMVNTYDVHFYASFALAALWPKLEISLQKDFAAALSLDHPEVSVMKLSGAKAPRKVPGAIPHDLGAPDEDPWFRVNAYDYQDVSRWKDLNSKFILQVYRDYLVTGDKAFLAAMWKPLNEARRYMEVFDRDGDGMIENDGFPDQTYDTWTTAGVTTYSGMLWAACNRALAAVAHELGHKDQAVALDEQADRANRVIDQALWNGDYYDYSDGDSAGAHNIMADQLCGHWYARACGLPGVVPAENAKRSLEHVHEFNVMAYGEGKLGAVNGMRPDGRPDLNSNQSIEVWTGTTFAVAACMLQEGLDDLAWETAKGIYTASYETFGYWFNTPEAWDSEGGYRSIGYMRPLAIWAIQWAWDQRKS